MNATALESAVFRFSNQDGNIVPLHSEFLTSDPDSYVWWGWWKKEHEPRRDNTLASLQKLVSRNGRLSVAFINRKDEEYYLAEIDDVRFHTGGKRSQAPDDKCPSVYRNREPGCPAWLRVRKIVRLSPEEYGRHFGDLPVGDPTLYELRKENGHRIAYPLPTWDLRPVVAPGDAILHLSDLHFGSLHGYRQVSDTAGDTVRQIRLVERIMDAVQLSGETIGVVVVSGDFVSKGWTDDYFVAEDFLTDLLERLGLGKKHLVVVPGNHDFKTLEALNAMPTMDYSHERSFRNFLKAYLKWDGPELERLQLFKMHSGEHVVFGCLNSARLRGRESKEYGYVGRHRYAEMFDFMNQSLAKSGIHARRIAVLHHHVLPVQEQEVPRDGVPISLTVDAAELFGELQERGFDAILHGHQHRPFFFRGGRSFFHTPTEVALPSRTVIVIGNGTSGAGSDALVPDFPFNSIGIHGVRPDFMKVRWYYFGPTVDPAVLSDWDVPWEGARAGAG